PRDAFTLDLLQASAKGRQIDMHYQPVTDQMYLKDSYEMSLLFHKDILDNTDEILRRCNVTIETNQMHLPRYPLPEKATSENYLRQLCIVGLKKRFKGKKVPTNYIQRLKKELSVIHKMGFNDYFLIVFDYVRYAKNQHILVGPGRGSAAGSLVSYVLGITNVDPIQYDLFFERFLNEERISMPDIDIDFQDDRRDEVVEYVSQKYGQEHVGQIVTFSTYGPKVALKDLGKVVSVSLAKLELMCKYIPTGKNKMTVREVYETSYAFQNLVNKEPALKRILPCIDTVERLPRNISMHAAGVVLSNDCLNEIVPLTKGPNHNILTQYSKDYIESVGLLKMDFLGLKNLTIISYILKNIEESEGIHLNLNDIDYHDKKTYQMLSNGDTLGVFQLESSGMKDLLRKMKPDCLDDIVAAIALYRPGPMKDIPHYIARKFKKENVEYPLPELEDVLKSTYGILIYQEQIMQVAQIVAGFSLSKADILRKAMSKKTASLMASMENDFIEGALQNGYSEDDAHRIFDLIERFANYGFNKSHSVAYGIVAYQLAYLKANHPLAFYGAVLSNEQNSDVHKANYINEAKRYGIKILLPSVNFSTDRFVEEDGNLRYSLLGIKNVGIAGYKAIIEEREKGGLFQDVIDFISRMDSSKVNVKMLDSLIDAGAFDEFQMNRATIKANLKQLMEYADLKNKIGIDEPPILENVTESQLQRLELEKNVLGVYLSRHPITYIKQKLNVEVVPISALSQYINKNVQVILSITRVKAIVDKKGHEMCFIEGYDETGSIEGVVFAFAYQKARSLLQKGKIVYIEGKVDHKNQLSLIVNHVKEIK
ncbi:MAG: DNA polymerase III subunit alpha, partial [Faecalibacillus sp.]